MNTSVNDSNFPQLPTTLNSNNNSHPTDFCIISTVNTLSFTNSNLPEIIQNVDSLIGKLKEVITLLEKIDYHSTKLDLPTTTCFQMSSATSVPIISSE